MTTTTTYTRELACVPIRASLTRLDHAQARFERTYNLRELKEDGIDVLAMLTHMTERHVQEALDAQGAEPAIAWEEIKRVLLPADAHGGRC